MALAPQGYFGKRAISMSHMCGTFNMGRPWEPGTFVSVIVGLPGSMEVDMGVAPFAAKARSTKYRFRSRLACGGRGTHAGYGLPDVPAHHQEILS